MFVKRNKIYIVSLFTSIILFLVFSFLFYKPPEKISFYVENNIHKEDLSKQDLKDPPKIEKSKETLQEDKLENDLVGIKVSLIASENRYDVLVKEGSSVFEAMQKIAKENNNFSFKYTEHPSLGNFITEINGLEGVPGKYWIYYINDEKATVGVSNLILKSGDIIRWNQEGI